MFLCQSNKNCINYNDSIKEKFTFFIYVFLLKVEDSILYPQTGGWIVGGGTLICISYLQIIRKYL